MKPTKKFLFTIDSIVGNNVSEAVQNTDGEKQSSNKRLRSPSPLNENLAQRYQPSSVPLQQLAQQQRVPPLHPYQQQPSRQQVYFHQQAHPLTTLPSHMRPYFPPHSSTAVQSPPALPMNMPDVRAIPAYINTPRELQRQQSYIMAAAQFDMARQAALVAGVPYSIPSSLVLAAQHAQFLRFSGATFHLPRPKRVRTQFTPVQLLKLEETFEINRYVVGTERKELAIQLGLSETKVKVWFQNRRTKTKRQDSDGGSCGTDSSSEHYLQQDESQSSEESDLLIPDSCEKELEIV